MSLEGPIIFPPGTLEASDSLQQPCCVCEDGRLGAGAGRGIRAQTRGTSSVGTKASEDG